MNNIKEPTLYQTRGSSKTHGMIAQAILEDMRKLGTKTVDEWIALQKDPQKTADILRRMGMYAQKQEVSDAEQKRAGAGDYLAAKQDGGKGHA